MIVLQFYADLACVTLLAPFASRRREIRRVRRKVSVYFVVCSVVSVSRSPASWSRSGVAWMESFDGTGDPYQQHSFTFPLHNVTTNHSGPVITNLLIKLAFLSTKRKQNNGLIVDCGLWGVYESNNICHVYSLATTLFVHERILL